MNSKNANEPIDDVVNESDEAESLKRIEEFVEIAMQRGVSRRNAYRMLEKTARKKLKGKHQI